MKHIFIFIVGAILCISSYAQTIGTKVNHVDEYGKKYTVTIIYIQDGKFKVKYDVGGFEEWLTRDQFTVIQPGTATTPKNTYERDERQETNTRKTSSSLYIGEYASYGAGGRPLIGLAFILLPNGRYYDLDKTRGGTYVYDPGRATISFKSGFLDGLVGNNVSPTGFKLNNKISCEPWKY